MTRRTPAVQVDGTCEEAAAQEVVVVLLLLLSRVHEHVHGESIRRPVLKNSNACVNTPPLPVSS